MIEIEGRVLAGLDEFMLRAGHLLVLCRVAHEVGGSWARIHREAADKLSSPVSVGPDQNHEVATYLATKGLCRMVEPQANNLRPANDYLYPELEVYPGPTKELLVRKIGGEGHACVSWQDRNLAVSRIRSRVGALTWSAKPGSKTGLSHVCDWAQFLDLIDSAGQLSPIGRLLVTVTDFELTPFEKWNPYVLGAERAILAYQYLTKDFDLFARFVPLLLHASTPLSKATCRTLFVDALRSCISDADASKTLSSRTSFELFQQIRDLELSARKARTEIEQTSTAWHRAASRVEILADLGLLEKGRLGDSEKYKYIYYPTEQLAYAVKTLELAKSGDQWIEQHMLTTILGVAAASGQNDEPMPDEMLLAGLNRIVHALKLPTTQFPIGCLVLGLAYLNANDSMYHSLQVLRNMVEALPLKYPDLARLARGREGTRAEYLSLNLRKLTEI